MSKQIHVKVRLEATKDTKSVAKGTVEYRIVNGDDREYRVTLVNGVATSCVAGDSDELCEAGQFGRICYHKKQCEQIEALRAVYLDNHGSLSGFCFVAPVEEKQTRKPAIETPTDVIAMKAMVSRFLKTTSKRTRATIAEVFAGMANEQGMIIVQNDQWFFDGFNDGGNGTIYEVYESIMPPVETEEEEEEEFSEEKAPVWITEDLATVTAPDYHYTGTANQQIGNENTPTFTVHSDIKLSTLPLHSNRGFSLLR